MKIDQETLKTLIDYDPVTGQMFWRDRPEYMFPTEAACRAFNKNFSGKQVGTRTSSGYITTTLFNNKKYYAHRLAWLYEYGEWPEGQIDHINHVRWDNRLCNLRVVTHQENGRNVKLSSRNTSGVVGVYWNKRDRKWQAFITKNKKAKFLGYFDDLESAAKARKVAEIEMGFHKNHGEVV